MTQAANSAALRVTDLAAALDPDPVRAGVRYEELRRQLVRFFEWQRHADPEDAAQETLTRGFRRVLAGVDTSRAGIHGYFFGIAKNLVKEGWKTSREELVDPSAWETTPSSARHVEQVEARLALTHYLSKLPSSERRLLVRYYTGDRDALSRELGVTAGNLRVIVHRIRQKLDSIRG
jgi:RNA polymerase sigma-70 factor (ECF subfamily)